MNFPATLPFAPADLRETLFPPTSRYHGVEIKTLEREGGRPVAYLGRRFLPSLDRFVTVREHMVKEGDRPDLLAYETFGDAEQFWRLCDANDVTDPNELTAEPGRRIHITLPEGVPAAPVA